MADPSHSSTNDAEAARGFPYLTAIATLATLFLFLGLMIVAYRSPNYLGDPTLSAEPKADPAAKLAEVRARNEAIVEGNPGTGTKMSVADATAKLLGSLRSEKDALPFPMPEPPAPPAPEPKKK